MKLKIHVVDLETGEVKDPIPIRAEHTWTIEELKVVIGYVSGAIISKKKSFKIPIITFWSDITMHVNTSTYINID